MCVTLIFRYTPLQLVHWMCFKCWNWIMFFFLHTEIEIQTKLHIGNEIRSKLSQTLSNLRLVSPSNPPPPLSTQLKLLATPVTYSIASFSSYHGKILLTFLLIKSQNDCTCRGVFILVVEWQKMEVESVFE